MESDTFPGDFIAELICRLSGDLIYRIFSLQYPDNVQTSFTIKLP